jgi:glycosyltransferase involved in cell wall biosynthesis
MDSLERQTFNSLEIILVDDGSTDESPVLCDAYAEQMDIVSVIHKRNQGLGEARNSGLKVAKGKYVTFLDSDDYIDEDTYLQMMCAIREEKSDAVFCDFVMVRADGRKEELQSQMQPGKYSGEHFLLNLLGAEPEAKRDINFDMSVCKGIYVRDIIEKNHIRFQSERKIMCEDLVFNIEYLQRANTVTYIARSLYYYCENQDSLTHKYIDKRLEKEISLYKLVKQMIPKSFNEDSLLYYDRQFLGRVRSTITQEVKYCKDKTRMEALVAIRRIINDPVVRTVVKEYPIRYNPIKLRVFNSFLRCRFVLGLYVLIMLNR